MTIRDILASKKVSLSFEIFPSKQPNDFTKVFQTAEDLVSLHPDFMSVTYGAGGTTRVNTVEIASHIQNLQVPSLAHLTCVGSSEEDLLNTIQSMKSHGIENVLALRGDLPKDLDNATIPGFSHASDLTALLKKHGFCVGGACYPEGHPESSNREVDIDNLKYKVDAGVDFLTTQMFFDNDMFYSFLYRLQSAGIRVPVLAGIMPITSPNQISRIIELSDAFIPKELLAMCDRFKDSPDALRQAGIAYASQQIIDLVSNGVRGIHIYTMNKPSIARAIMHNIDCIFDACNGVVRE
ncbi:MAG: methylenetetrahydrofolate reductase [NAD(P)H] [Treponema sp.]|nr:methylenetetrahydrofolate reductase [NAD(P)H] [Treponema sp.]